MNINFFYGFCYMRIFFEFCVFSFGSVYTSCKAYDDSLSFRDTDDKYGICDEIKLTSNNLIGSGYMGGARPGSLE